jgi:hypothetical protein
VSGSLFATNFADTTNGTWFPWTNGNNYIRGTTTYLSGFIVDEQDSRFYLNPAETNVLKNVAVSGSITGPAPTASNHLATKAYVDAAVSAGGGGGGLNVYKSDGTTLLGRLVRYDEGGFVYGWTPDQSEFSYYVGDPNTQLSFIYADTEGIIRQAIRSERAAVATKSHFSEPDCGGTEYWSQQNGSYVRWCAANWFSYYAAPYHLNQKT